MGRLDQALTRPEPENASPNPARTRARPEKPGPIYNSVPRIKPTVNKSIRLMSSKLSGPELLNLFMQWKKKNAL